MKKLLLLLCLPIIGFAQVDTVLSNKSKISVQLFNSGVFFTPRFGVVSQIVSYDIKLKSNFGICSDYFMTYMPQDLKSEIEEDFNFYHSLLLGFSYKIDIIKLRLMTGLIHYRSPNKEFLHSEGAIYTKSKFAFSQANLLGASVVIKKIAKNYLTINVDRFFTSPITIETTQDNLTYKVGPDELTTTPLTEKVAISTFFLTIGFTKYL